MYFLSVYLATLRMGIPEDDTRDKKKKKNKSKKELLQIQNIFASSRLAVSSYLIELYLGHRVANFLAFLSRSSYSVELETTISRAFDFVVS